MSKKQPFQDLKPDTQYNVGARKMHELDEEAEKSMDRVVGQAVPASELLGESNSTAEITSFAKENEITVDEQATLEEYAALKAEETAIKNRVEKMKKQVQPIMQSAYDKEKRKTDGKAEKVKLLLSNGKTITLGFSFKVPSNAIYTTFLHTDVLPHFLNEDAYQCVESRINREELEAQVKAGNIHPKALETKQGTKSETMTVR